MSDIKEAYSEINMILPLLEDELINKIPESIKNFFETEKDNEYRAYIDANKPFDEQQLKRETIILLTMLKLRYWCENEKEKQELIQELSNNDIELKKVLNQKYDFNEIFKQNVKFETNTNAVELIEQTSKNLIQRIIEKLKSKFLKKR